MAGDTGPERPTVAELLARSNASPLSRSYGRPSRAWRRAVRRWAAVVVVLLLLLAGYYVGLLVYVDNAVDRLDVLRLSGPEILSADRQREAENFLLVGSDDGDRDTTIVVHLSQDGSQAVVIVLPGDAYVDVPACQNADDQPTEPYSGPFSSVYGTGGAGCLVRAVQLLTGLRINHYVQLDLAGVPSMVDAVGGVPLCLGSALRDRVSGLDLPAGTAVIQGEQTLPFLRLQIRQGPAETERIERQQQFLASLLDRFLAPRTVVDPVRLTRFLTAVTGSLTLDPDTTFGDLQNLVELLRDLNTESVLLLSAPIAGPDVTPAGSSTSYPLLDEQLGRQLYQSIIDDSALPVPRASDSHGRRAPAGTDCS